MKAISCDETHAINLIPTLCMHVEEYKRLEFFDAI